MFAPGTSFAWSPTVGLSNPLVQNPTAYLDGYTLYMLVINRPEGCSDTLDVPVNGRYDVMDAGPDVNACAGEPALLGLPDNTSDYTYTWTPASFLANASSATPTAVVTEDTQFNVLRIPNAGTPGCPAKDSVQVLLVSKPTALFGYSFFAACEGITAAFTDSSTDYQSLSWTFSTGNGTTLENPVIAFPYNDTLSAVLIVQNGECRDTFSLSEYIEDISKYYKENESNAFSPNGDGQNDCFSPALQLSPEPFDKSFLPCSELYVYTRWGELIYESTKEEQACWNGKSQTGEEMPEGVYFYRYRFGSTERAALVHLRIQ